MKQKTLVITISILVFVLLFSIGIYYLIRDINPNNNINEAKKTKKREYKELKQAITCSNNENLFNDNDEIIGNKTTNYYMEFKGDTFIAYKKDILLTFNNNEAYQEYCLSCDNIEANDIKSITKGIDIKINHIVGKYIYENITIDLKKYDGELKETKYGLDGLNTKSNIDNALFLTRDMVCYWNN